MKQELNSLEDNGIWELTILPARKKAIGSKWFYKAKLKPDGTVDRCAARLIAKDYHQLIGVHYFNSFSPVVELVTVRLFLPIASGKS